MEAHFVSLHWEKIQLLYQLLLSGLLSITNKTKDQIMDLIKMLNKRKNEWPIGYSASWLSCQEAAFYIINELQFTSLIQQAIHHPPSILVLGDDNTDIDSNVIQVIIIVMSIVLEMSVEHVK